MLDVLRVHEAPEAVVHAIDAHLHEHEEVPVLLLEQVHGDLVPPGVHLVHLAQQVVLVLGAEVLHVEHVVADQRLHLGLQLLG